VSFSDSLGSCYRSGIQSRDERLSAASEGTGCPGNANRLDVRSRPDHPWLAPLDSAPTGRK
jgi:hypothetical protein